MDFSWSEMLLVGVVALIVIGPKDLPGMFRELGRFTAKIRSMGREFSRAMEQAAKESGVKEATDGLKALSNPVGTGLNSVKSAADKFEKWDPIKNAAKPTTPLTSSTLTPPPMPPSPKPADAAVETVTAAETVAETVAEAAAPEVGPNTAALYKKQAARKAVLAETAAKLKAIEAGEVEAAPAAKTPGRRRKKPDASGGDEA